MAGQARESPVFFRLQLKAQPREAPAVARHERQLSRRCPSDGHGREAARRGCCSSSPVSCWWPSSRPACVSSPQELFNVDHKPISDGLSKLPATYDGVRPDKKIDARR